MTRKQYLRILIALIGVDGLGIAAKSQETDKIVVNIPYEIVVVGKTLPAGTHGVSRGPIYPNGLKCQRFADMCVTNLLI